MKKQLYPLSNTQIIDTIPPYLLSSKSRDLLSFGISVTIENPDIDSLKKAYNHYLFVNDALRTQYLITIKGIRQYIREYKEEDIPVIEVKDEKELQKKMESIRRINHIFSDIPICYGYIFTYNNKASLYIRVHHIAFDGYSMGLTIKEITEYYDAYSKGMEPKIQEKKYHFVDYLKENVENKKSGKYKRDCIYWKNKFNSRKDFKAILPKNHSRSLTAYKNVIIDKKQYIELTNLCKEYGVPLFQAVLSIASLSIYKITGKIDFNFMTFSHGRNTLPKKGLIGDMVDLLVSFYHINVNDKLVDYFRNNYMDYLDGMKHPNLNPLTLIFLILKTELRLMRFNFYGLIFSNLNIMDYSGEIDSKYQLGGVSNKYQPNQFYIMVTDNHTNLLNIGITYQSKAIKEERLNKYIETFNQILINILNNKEAQIKDIL